MDIHISTPNGTFIVPDHKVASLIMWLQQNAVKAGQQPVRFPTQESAGHSNPHVVELLNEGY